jgi:hypothetical protein
MGIKAFGLTWNATSFNVQQEALHYFEHGLRRLRDGQYHWPAFVSGLVPTSRLYDIDVLSIVGRTVSTAPRVLLIDLACSHVSSVSLSVFRWLSRFGETRV